MRKSTINLLNFPLKKNVNSIILGISKEYFIYCFNC